MTSKACSSDCVGVILGILHSIGSELINKIVQIPGVVRIISCLHIVNYVNSRSTSIHEDETPELHFTV